MDIRAAKEFSISWSFFWQNYRRRLIAAIVASIFLSLLEMFGVSMILPLFSMGIESETSQQLPFLNEVREAFAYLSIDISLEVLFTIFMVSWVLKSFVAMGLGLFVNNSTILITKDLRHKVILSIRDTAWSFFNQQRRGEIVNMMTQEIDRCGGVFSVMQTVIVSFLMFIVYILVGVAVNFEVLVSLIAFAVLGFVFARPMFNMARRAGEGELEGLKDIASDLLQGISGLKAFKAMGRERDLLRALSNANDSFVSASKLKTRAQIFLGFSQEMVFALAVLLAFGVMHKILGYPLIEIGFMGYVLLKLNTHLSNLLKKFQAISVLTYGILKYQERINGFLSHPENAAGHDDYIYPSVIEFKDVSFTHTGEGFLKHVNLEFPETGVTLLSGPSGSGKTTLIDLLCGFYEPDGGAIYIGGHDFQKINFRNWRKNIGYVTQVSALLDSSIRDNISAFNTKLSDDDVWEALQLAGAASFVEVLPAGLDASVGEEGSQVSGGEKQRLALARALAQHPKLLILDEPTAALDADVEAEIIETIRNLAKNICIIVVSHQPAWIDLADRIYDVQAGRVTLRSGDA